MSEAKFTKGPWSFYKARLRPDFPTVIREIHSATGVLIQWGGFDAVDLPGSKLDANGRLIAAAPDLYEACRLASRVLENAYLIDSDRRQAVAMLQSALKKAEGVE